MNFPKLMHWLANSRTAGDLFQAAPWLICQEAAWHSRVGIYSDLEERGSRLCWLCHWLYELVSSSNILGFHLRYLDEVISMMPRDWYFMILNPTASDFIFLWMSPHSILFLYLWTHNSLLDIKLIRNYSLSLYHTISQLHGCRNNVYISVSKRAIPVFCTTILDK